MARVCLALAVLIGVLRAQDGPETVTRGTKQFRKKVLVSGLAGPWEITWGPDNMLWVTERTGKRVTRIDPVTGVRKVAITIDEVSAPGSQDGLLGMALHPELLQGTRNDFVYVAYTYVDKRRPPHITVADSNSPYRYLYAKLVRFTYNRTEGTLSDPSVVIEGLPAGNDHQSGRLKIGPDRKLYYTIGDQGNDQLGHFCLPIEAQRLPTEAEVRAKNYVAYVGKCLRVNLDGSVPADNPKIEGLVSHVYTYGHRNMEGIDFAPDGTLYASEQGPKTDDEINILKPGSNYGWPHVAGKRDNKAYEYARWSDATTPCSQLTFSDITIHPSVPREPESAFKKPFVEPIATMFTVPTGFNFQDPACKGVNFICWATTGASSIEYYRKKGAGIPGWNRVLLVTTLKRGSLYVATLSPGGQSTVGHMSRYFQSENRYRDTAISPDGKTIYIATDPGGLAEAIGGGTTRTMENPGAILTFTYEGEGTGAAPAPPVTASKKETALIRNPATVSGVAPAFTVEQASSGKVAFEANCATCHGNTLTNGTFGPPLAGEYFRNTWPGRTVGALHEKAKAMPPAAPGSLTDDAYVNIVAYILQVNDFKAGQAPLPSSATALDGMTIK